MGSFSAKDVQVLRQSTGAGIMDAKRALEACQGDQGEAAKWLRERGLSSAAKRSERENSQGALAISKVDGVAAIVELKSETDFVAKSDAFVNMVGELAEAAAIVELKSETDFVAKSDAFVNMVGELAEAVARNGESAIDTMKDLVDDLKVSMKENIEVGSVIRFESAPGNTIGEYLHVQNERGVNAVLVELEGDYSDKAHDVALHIAFAKPEYLSREMVPEDIVAEEKKTLETLSRNEGKPEASIDKIVTGRLNGFFKERCLVEQAYVKDEKVSIADYVSPSKIVRYAQVTIGT